MFKVGDYVFSKTSKDVYWPGQVILTDDDDDTGKVCVKFIGVPPRTKPKWVERGEAFSFDPLTVGLNYANPKLKKALESMRRAVEGKSGTSCLPRVTMKHVDLKSLGKDVVISNPLTGGHNDGKALCSSLPRVILKPVDLDSLEEDIVISDEVKEVLMSGAVEESCKELVANVIADNKAFLDAIDSDDEAETNTPKAPVALIVGKKKKRVENSLFNLISKTTKLPVAIKPEIVALQDRSLSDYEKIQASNREKRQQMLNQAAKEWKEATSLLGLNASLNEKKRKSVPRRSLPVLPTRVMPTRAARQRLDSTGSSNRSSLYDVTPRKRYLFDEDLLNDDDLVAAKKRKKRIATWNGTENLLSVESITDAMLENVCDFVSEKIYDTERGTSCHQCRQKTLDMKTVCRSGRCHGFRGAFCGVCLRNRYAQDARESLLDATWECPPCRGVCNCSICRKRMGKRATGIMTKIALDNGFQSVHHLLVGHHKVD